METLVLSWSPRKNLITDGDIMMRASIFRAETLGYWQANVFGHSTNQPSPNGHVPKGCPGRQTGPEPFCPQAKLGGINSPRAVTWLGGYV